MTEARTSVINTDFEAAEQASKIAINKAGLAIEDLFEVKWLI